MERSVLSKYPRVSPVIRSSPSSSGSNLDCSSNTTLVTSTSPFNSQTALITEKKHFSGDTGKGSNHYYAENLRNNHLKTLNRSRIYDPLNKNQDVDYKQLDPLLPSEQNSSINILMDSQDVKLPKDLQEPMRLPSSEFQKVPKPSWIQFSTQILAALSVSLGSMQVGYSSSYTSPALVSMRDNTTAGFEVTKHMSMWVGSLMPLSALIGGIAGGPLIEYIGRKKTILATAFPFIGSWLLIAMAQNIPMVLAGRALCGFAVGIASLALPVYLGETIQAEVRGTLGLMPTVFGNTGILLCFVAGMYLDWRNLALIGATLPLPFLILMFVIPETPRWYISKGKTKMSRKSLQWLRGKDTDITDELTMIEKIHQEYLDSERSGSQNVISELSKSKHLRPLLISLGLMLFQQMSGINAVIFYTVQIFQDAGSTIDENISTIIIGIVNFISTFVAASVIDKLGRKMLLYISAVLMALTLFSLGGFFYVKSLDVDVTAFGWLPLVSLIVYVIGFSLGFGPIPWLMMGEILPAQIRGSAASIATSFNWMCTFIVTKTFEDVIGLIGAHGTFWMFGIIVVVGFVFVIISVPETRGRSLEEIEKKFTGPTRRMSAIANMKPTPMSC
ncbi:facilitated trehalose transporter Tret1 isoform X2 [Monomorium pharaonis]|uniref:facilitated trehalose transporter Tret1 isoform X3 n=1 Tax=Monomorium pharaonis TaxID=307658 RepID=UPI00102E1576|nr:facilitated trehalose transporter Tret1 isoform X3 [Monomorium pharaonis]XP_036140774.1 facilitated trehalose transporter Tret1 isoform X2 [Monomorium pharaonis]